MEKIGLKHFMKHNYKIPQKPQEKEGLKERTKLKRNLRISHAVIGVRWCEEMVRETGENAAQLWLSQCRDLSGSGKPDCGEIRVLG